MSRALRRRPGLKQMVARRVAKREELARLRRERARAAEGISRETWESLDPAVRAHIEELEKEEGRR